MSNLGSVKILGESSINGGAYNNITILGEAFTRGAVECNNVTILGDIKFNDEVKANNIKILGTAVAESKCIVNKKLKILGNLDAKEDFEISNGKVLGEGAFEKNLIFQDINVLGEVNIKGNCEGNFFKSKGQVNIEGLLSADKIDIDSKSVNMINEIGGSEIIIKKTGLFTLTKGRVMSNVIEGDKVILENTHCKIVRGHNIDILSGCIIDRIEYTGILNVHVDSRVGEEICLKN